MSEQDRLAERRGRAAAALAEVGADAALITDLVNVRYLTGLASSNAALLLYADGEAILATDSRYAEAARRDCAALTVAVVRQVAPALVSRAAERGVGTCAYEAHQLTVERHDQLAALDDAPRLVPLGRVVERLRMDKDDAEIGLLARACEITCSAFAELLEQIAPGRTERELAVAVERAMVDRGAESAAFETIIASGPNGALPHHVPGQRTLRRGDLVTIDCGARYGGYHADMTRTVALGEPSEWQREIYELVAAAQRAGVAAATADAVIEQVDAAARDVIAAAGHGAHFGHGLGHGVGLAVHELPMIGPGDHGTPGKLGDRIPVTVEPGVYLPGKGGVRIEDTLVVRPGPVRILTTTTRELLVL